MLATTYDPAGNPLRQIDANGVALSRKLRRWRLLAFNLNGFVRITEKLESC